MTLHEVPAARLSLTLLGPQYSGQIELLDWIVQHMPGDLEMLEMTGTGVEVRLNTSLAQRDWLGIPTLQFISHSFTFGAMSLYRVAPVAFIHERLNVRLAEDGWHRAPGN